MIFFARSETSALKLGPLPAMCREVASSRPLLPARRNEPGTIAKDSRFRILWMTLLLRRCRERP